MKKILSILITICLLASALSLSAFAALLTEFDAAPVDAVLRISALKSGETTPVIIGEYTNFEDGWNDAMELAKDKAGMRKADYDRIVVDLYTDWKADNEGRFSDDWNNGPGFDNDTIYVPAEAKVTLNLNGHTINRGLTKDVDDGEVMFINDNADVIINDGTITGGYSNSEGGGLYIEGGANVTLNNVHVDGNAVVGDDGSGIYLYGGATLIMNGGSLSNNFLDEKWIFVDVIEPFGTLCAVDSTVILNNVIIDGNYTVSYQAKGLILHATRSIVKMNQCTVSGNLAKGTITEEAIYVKDSSLTITDTNFTNNNTLPVPKNYALFPYLFCVEDSDLSMAGGNITGNGGDNLFYFEDSRADIKGVTITDNTAGVMRVDNDNEVVNMAECTLGNNIPKDDKAAIVIKNPGNVTMVDCVLGDTTFSNREYLKITTSGVSKDEAVIGIDLLRADGTSITSGYYKDFVSGWSFAMECVQTNAYDRLIIDLYADWNTNAHGAIEIPENTRVTINLNGHTINRGLAECKLNGEVVCVSPNAVLTINDGTITGGFSGVGAGGIHVETDATVILNNVHVDGNTVEDDDGAAIALYDGAVLVMNGGSISDNYMRRTWEEFVGVFPYGSLYVNDSTATLNGVTISNNHTASRLGEGMAVYAVNSTVTLNACTVTDNGLKSTRSAVATSVVTAVDSKLIVTNTDFTGNGCHDPEDDGSHLFYMEDSSLTMEGGNVTGNNTDKLFLFKESDADIKNVTVADNESVVLNVENNSAQVTLTECILGGNAFSEGGAGVVVETAGTLVLTDCDLGDTDFENKSMVTGVGSIFGEGSLTTIFVIIALIDSIVSIYMIVLYKKKNAVSANVAEGEE